MTAEERLNAIKPALIDGPVNPDSVGLALYYLKDKFEQGWRFGGFTWEPVKRKDKVTEWRALVNVYRMDEEGNLEEASRRL
jgi:hypothetical protein